VVVTRPPPSGEQPDDGHRYDSLVSASSRDEAIEIASEALPRGKQAARVEAVDVSAREGPDSWLVTIWFEGDFGRGIGD
jgi:hypothetical protein